MSPKADRFAKRMSSAAFAPLAMVVDPAFTWGEDRPPRTPWHKTLIYEAHVKSFFDSNRPKQPLQSNFDQSPLWTATSLDFFLA